MFDHSATDLDLVLAGSLGMVAASMLSNSGQGIFHMHSGAHHPGAGTDLMGIVQ
jgi:hypothetical protein